MSIWTGATESSSEAQKDSELAAAAAAAAATATASASTTTAGFLVVVRVGGQTCILSHVCSRAKGERVSNVLRDQRDLRKIN